MKIFINYFIAFLLVVVLTKEVEIRGTFRLTGIFPITTPENTIDFQNGVMMAEAMKYAVEKVNKLDYLKGYRLNITGIFDNSNEKAVRKSVLQCFVDEVNFLIGPYSSETSYLASILTDTFTIIAFSYGATYGDFGRFGMIQDYMYRTVPSDEYRNLATLKFISELHWNYIGIISSHGYDGERDALDFMEKLPNYKICLSSQFNIKKYRNNDDVYEEAIKQMDSDKRLKFIILFTTHKDSKKIFQIIRKLGLIDRFQIMCVYGCINNIDVLKGNEEVANGTLSLSLHNPEIKEFKEYFLKKKPGPQEERYFKTFWENVFNCNLQDDNKTYNKKCNGSEKLAENLGYYPQTPVHTVIDAVFSLAKSLLLYITDTCHRQRLKSNNTISDKTFQTCDINIENGYLFVQRVKNLAKSLIYEDGTFKIETYGSLTDIMRSDFSSEIRYDINDYSSKLEGIVLQAKQNLIWKWTCIRDKTTTPLNVEKFQLFKSDWFIKSHEHIHSSGRCSSKCKPGFYKDYDQNFLKSKCCWTCRPCPKNNKVDNNTCIACKNTEFVDEKFEKCESMPIKGTPNSATIAFILFSILGLFLALYVVAVFTKFSKNQIVIASSRELCYIILCGICLSFICPSVFLIKTAQASCIMRGSLPGFAFLTCYLPLFLKTNRIYRILSNAKVSLTRPSLMSAQSQFFAIFIMLTVQLVFNIIWFIISKAPMAEPIISEDQSYVTVHCSTNSNPLLFVLNISLSILFIICCTILAFKTRNFSENYNEAKHIGITLFVTCIVWTAFLPTFFLARNSKSDFLREYLICVLCLLIGYITLFGIFGPKMLMIYQSSSISTTNQRSIPTQHVAEDLSKDVLKDDESSSLVTTTKPPINNENGDKENDYQDVSIPLNIINKE